MQLDTGYPRAVTIAVPISIPDGEIGDYVSNEVVSFLSDLGTAGLARRSLTLRFISERLALLQFDSHQSILLSQGVRERYAAAKATLNSAPQRVTEAESSQSAKVATRPFNRKEPN